MITVPIRMGVVFALTAALTVHATLAPATSAFASGFGVELNGTYRVISNGDWAKSNDVFLAEKTVVQTWDGDVELHKSDQLHRHSDERPGLERPIEYYG